MMRPVVATRLDVDGLFQGLRCRFPDILFVEGRFDALDPAVRARIDAIVTSGAIGAAAQEMAVLPALRLIACLGSGHENIDVAEAGRRGIAVCTGAGANAETVADHALALLLSLVRQVPLLDARTRQGAWRQGLPALGTLYGKRLGLLGFGAIGQAVAQRAAGFGMQTRYFSRSDRGVASARHCGSLVALAEGSDIVVCSLPGTQDLLHAVDAKFFRALGPDGIFVNVGRGTSVNTQDLADALNEGRLAGAALDVYEPEPDGPDCLLRCPNLVLSPHVAGISAAAAAAQFELLSANVAAMREGRALLTPLV